MYIEKAIIEEIRGKLDRGDLQVFAWFYNYNHKSVLNAMSKRAMSEEMIEDLFDFIEPTKLKYCRGMYIQRLKQISKSKINKNANTKKRRPGS